MFTMPRAFAVVILGSLLSANAAEPAPATIQGMVALDGTPVAKGRILFYQTEDDQIVGAKVKDGQFKVGLIATGKYRVTVEGEGVPARYGNEEKAVLAVKVIDGKNQFDFHLDR